MLDRLEQRPVLLGLLIAAIAQALFTLGVERPSVLLFDEVHYVPAARVLLAFQHITNPEHPMLGKALIALGIHLFGDNALGWRALSTLFGTATIVGVYAFTLLLTRATRAALFAAIFALLGQMVFVQARIGMLDIFMGEFLVWAGVAFLAAMRGRGLAAWGWWIACAVLFGAAVGVKWAAAPYVGVAGIAFLWLKFRDSSRFAGLHWLVAPLVLGIVSIASYFATFAPAFFYAEHPMTLARLIPFQREMWALQTQVLPAHNYQSSWWSWPLMLRPIWYFYEPDQGAMRGVLLIGNPAVLWTGLVAVVACWWAGIRDRAGVPLAAAMLWTFSIAIWAIIPKSLGFFYYYYLSSIILCVVLAVAIQHWQAWLNRREEWLLVAVVGLFAYFYPILSAQALTSERAFLRWMWLPGWI